jgi:hypothetical protein
MKNRLILEFSEFNMQRYSSDSRLISTGTTVDNNLSTNAFSRYEDSIRVGVSRINNIMKSMSNSGAYRSLKQKLTFEKQIPSNLKIQKIIPENTDYSIYVTTVIDKFEYDCIINNILSRNPTLNSNMFKTDNLVQNEEWQIKIKGLIIESIKKWLNIKPNKYTLLNDEIVCTNTNTGKIKVFKKGSVIEVLNTSLSENKILIKSENDTYNLTKDNFIYFNYWFESKN